jgi:uncharacterized membrane protein HdeD (DUF308 family)
MLHVLHAPEDAVTGQSRILTLAMIAQHAGQWHLLGLAMVALGAAAIALPGLGPSPLTPWMPLVPLGALLIGDALLQSLHSRLLPRQGGSGWRLTGALASLAAGLVLVGTAPEDPMWPTIAIQLLLLVSGIAKGFLALTLEPLRGWHGLFAIAVVTASLGLGLLVSSAPAHAALLPSLVGLALLLDGAWTLQTARMARRRSLAVLRPH